MLSKNKIRFIRSLDTKKVREEEDCFLAEGNKLVNDTIRYFDCRLLVATEQWLEQHPDIRSRETITATKEEIRKCSLLKNPQEVIAVYRKPEHPIEIEALKGCLVLALDTVQDPGNLGTIVRIADWFGIRDIVCSETCADIYNPKTVQATMGALARVRVHYTSLADFLRQIHPSPVYGTFLEGNDIYREELSPNGVIVMGNEGNGISEEIKPFVERKLYIPNYPPGTETSESLNVAIATAITCAEFRRRARSN